MMRNMHTKHKRSSQAKFIQALGQVLHLTSLFSFNMPMCLFSILLSDPRCITANRWYEYKQCVQFCTIPTFTTPVFVHWISWLQQVKMTIIANTKYLGNCCNYYAHCQCFYIHVALSKYLIWKLILVKFGCIKLHTILLQRKLVTTWARVLAFPIKRRGIRSKYKHFPVVQSKVTFACPRLTFTSSL